MLKHLLFIGALAIGSGARAQLNPILADRDLLELAGIEVLRTEPNTGVGYALITREQEERLSQLSHERGSCAGFESLDMPGLEAFHPALTHVFGQLAEQAAKNRRAEMLTPILDEVEEKSEVKAAIEEVSDAKIRETVEFLSAFPTRVHTGTDPNAHVEAFKTKLEALLSATSVRPWEVSLIEHKSTKQKSVRVRMPGAVRPNEIVVLGGHLDSINRDWMGNKTAPGADDNASGSSTVLEAMRILATQKQSERTLEFFWYAGEEGGLLGSAEIARDYKAQNRDVVAVLQLDMTMFPGDGEFVMGSMRDFTSAWLRSYLETINGIYVKARIVEDKCGYGCSDHASWHRQGYPALMPAEATFARINKNLHTVRDVIDGKSNFKHAAMFAKIAVVMGMDLANSEMREPK